MAVAVVPAALAGLPGRSLLGDGAAGYANASGALYLVAAAGAATLALRSQAARRRHLATLVAVGWVLAVVLVRADVLLVLAGLLSSVLVVRGTGASRVVLTVGLAAAAATLVAAAVLGLDYEPGPRTEPLSRVVDATLGPTRVVMWHEAVTAVGEEPVTGRGLGSLATQSPITGEEAVGHNEVLEVAAETGVVGGLLVAALIVWAFVRLWHSPLPRSASPAAIALAGVAVQANLDYVLHFPSVVVALGTLVGAAAGLSPTAADADPLPAARLGEPPVSAAVATLLAVVVLTLPSPLNPPHTVENGAEFLDDPPGVRFTGRGVLRSREAPHALYRALTAEPGLTVEVWAAAGDLDQDGPARLLSSSAGTGRRNLTLGQADDALVVRLRTLQTNWNATDAQVEVAGVFTDTRRRHLAVVHDGDVLRVYVDGQLRHRAVGPSGSYADWNFTYPLLFGNERGGDRPWEGRLEMVSFYDRPLAAAEVREGFEAGPVGDSDAAGSGPGTAARYLVKPPAGGTLTDSSAAGLGPTLVIPERLTVPADRFPVIFFDLRRFLGTTDADGDATRPTAAAIRLAGHALLFAAPAALVVRAAVARWSPARVVATVAGAATLVALLLSVARFLQHGSPSVLDVAGAAAGALLGAGLWAVRHV